MLGLLIEELRITVQTSTGEFETRIPFDRGLNIIRAENTSGKSTCVNAIAYAMGLEAILGPSRKRPFPRALYDTISSTKDETAQQEFHVIGSSVSLTIKNNKGETAEITRDVQGSEKMIQVRIGSDSAEYFLGSSGEVGSAKSEMGFHHWLAKFLGWELPTVVTYDGKEVPLYLECIFPLFFIEQKRGWSEIQANSPVHYGIRNVKKVATEYCLGIDSHEHEKKVTINQRIAAGAEVEWEQFRSAAEGIADFNSVRLTPIPSLSLELQDVRLEFQYVDNERAITADAKARALRRQIADLSTAIHGQNPRDEGLTNQLSIVRRIREQIAELSTSIELETTAIEQTNDKITRLKDDHNQYLQLRRLKNVGGQVISAIDTERCPVCEGSLMDTLGSRSTSRAPMTLDENISFLKNQIDFFDQIRRRGQTSIESLIREIKLANNRLVQEVAKLDAIKLELNEINGTAAGAMRERANAEVALANVTKLRTAQTDLEQQAARVLSKWRVATAALKQLRKEEPADNREATVASLEAIMKKYLVDFGFSTSAIHDIAISRQTLRPEQQGYDIVAETSASDYIRIIWAYTLALLALAGCDAEVRHGGFVVFDEPRQHEASKVSFTALIEKATESRNYNGQVIFATSLDERELEAVCNGRPVKLHCFKDYILKRTSTA